MDKKTFIRELKLALSVLKQEELDDIISEYEQHIDIKVEKGLTEAEAIADFGSFGELTAEILEAYHVRADYAADKGERAGRRWGDGQTTGWKARGAMLWEKVKTGGTRTASCVRWTVYQLFRPFAWAWKRCRELVRGLEERRGKELWEFDDSGTAGEARGRYGDGDLNNKGGRDAAPAAAKERGSGAGSDVGNPGRSAVSSRIDSGKSGDMVREAEIPENGSAGLEVEHRRYSGVRPEDGVRPGGLESGPGSREYGEAGPGDRNRRDRNRGVRPDRRGRTGRDFRDSGLRQRIKRKGKRIINDMGKGIWRICGLCVSAVFWTARMVWNGCWILFSLVVAGFGLFSLYGLGVLSVLLTQGYPLIGVTLGCLGLVMCAFSAAVLGITFLRRKENGTIKNKGSHSRQNRTEQKAGKQEHKAPRHEETGRGPEKKRELNQEGDRRAKPGDQAPWRPDREDQEAKAGSEGLQEREPGGGQKDVQGAGWEDHEPSREHSGTGWSGEMPVENPGEDPGASEERGQSYA